MAVSNTWQVIGSVMFFVDPVVEVSSVRDKISVPGGSRRSAMATETI